MYVRINYIIILYWYKNDEIAITWCKLYFILFSKKNETQTVTNVIEIILIIIKNNN